MDQKQALKILAEMVERGPRRFDRPAVSRPGALSAIYASGLSPGRMTGFAEAGYGIGISLGDTSIRTKKTYLAYLREANRVWEVFDFPGLMIDCGSVQETDLRTRRVVAPISDAVMDQRMDWYIEAARLLGSGAKLVTPDKIFDQEETVRRFERQVPKLRTAIRYGAVLFLAVQSGRLSLEQMDKQLRKILGSKWSSPSSKKRWREKVVTAIPMRQGATPVNELYAFVKKVKPAQVHLLGIGPKNRRLPGVLSEISRLSPKTRVSIDANLHRAKVGRDPYAGILASSKESVRVQQREPEAAYPQVDVTEWESLLWGLSKADIGVLLSDPLISEWKNELAGLDGPDLVDKLVELASESNDYEWRVFSDRLRRLELELTPLSFSRPSGEYQRRAVRRMWG